MLSVNFELLSCSYWLKVNSGPIDLSSCYFPVKAVRGLFDFVLLIVEFSFTELFLYLQEMPSFAAMCGISYVH